MRRKTIYALLIVVAFGLVRLPVESGLERDLRRRGLHSGALDLSLREQLGQASFVAVLGGFRSLVASLLALAAQDAWEDVQWGEVEGFYKIITRLQPRVVNYWDSAGHHMAYNAASYYQYDEEQPPALRKKLYDGYVQRGIEFFEDGILNRPDNYNLLGRLAVICQDRLRPPNECRAADLFAEAISKKGIPKRYRRYLGYALAKCPGREQEAYDLLRELYLEGAHHRKPSVLRDLAELEEKLDIPLGQRLIPGR